MTTKKDKSPWTGIDLDDKDLGIIALTVIAVCAMCLIADPVTIVSSIVTGITGVMVGRKGNGN